MENEKQNKQQEPEIYTVEHQGVPVEALFKVVERIATALEGLASKEVRFEVQHRVDAENARENREAVVVHQAFQAKMLEAASEQNLQLSRIAETLASRERLENIEVTGPTAPVFNVQQDFGGMDPDAIAAAFKSGVERAQAEQAKPQGYPSPLEPLLDRLATLEERVIAIERAEPIREAKKPPRAVWKDGEWVDVGSHQKRVRRAHGLEVLKGMLDSEELGKHWYPNEKELLKKLIDELEDEPPLPLPVGTPHPTEGTSKPIDSVKEFAEGDLLNRSGGVSRFHNGEWIDCDASVLRLASPERYRALELFEWALARGVSIEIGSERRQWCVHGFLKDPPPAADALKELEELKGTWERDGGKPYG